MDFTRIVADPAIGRTIGQAYLSTPERITPVVRDAYAAFARQVDQQFGQLTRDVRVTFTDDDPYADASELFRDIRRGSFAVWRTQGDQSHPLLTNEQNNRFRAVHDYFGHFKSGRGFDRHGEEAAWVCHSLMFAGEASRALTTETRGQSSAFVWVNGGGDNFPPQKAILLPQWMSDIPLKWLV
jgi:hypothetical protein